MCPFLCPCSSFLWHRIFSFFSYKNNSRQLRYCCCCDQQLCLYPFVTFILTPHAVYAVYLSQWIQYRWTDRQTPFEKDVGLKGNEVQFHMCAKQQIKLKIGILHPLTWLFFQKGHPVFTARTARSKKLTSFQVHCGAQHLVQRQTVWVPDHECQMPWLETLYIF